MNNAKFLSTLILALTVGVRAGLSFDFESERPVKSVDSLVVNTSKEFRTVAKKSEEAGIEDMRKLSGISSLEESWAYLPKDSTFIEIGVDEKSSDNANPHMMVDIPYLEKLLKMYDDMTIYHFHPVISKKLIDGEVNKWKKQGYSYTNDEVEFRMSIAKSTPSGPDLGFMVVTSEFFYLHGTTSPKASIKERICSKYGVAEFSLTEEGREYFKDKNFSQCMFDGQLSHASAYVSFSKQRDKSAQPDLISEIKRFCRLLSNEDIKVEFTPYSDLAQPQDSLASSAR
jgi:hypothetical protein